MNGAWGYWLMLIRCFAIGLAMAGAMAHAMPALASGEGLGAQKAFDAFLGCKPEFFAVLRTERAAFGASEVVSPAPDLAVEGMMETARVSFAAPVDINGIRLLKYTQMKASGEPEAWWWGFVTDRAPRDLIDAIRGREPTAEFIVQENMIFRVIEEGNVPGGTASARTMMINATENPNESLVLCIVTSDLMDGLKTLPDAADLFRQ
ncbi:hypothetical protein JVX98_10445 [Ensifer sp. PDNC004]|uniref:hypothetical protein n=1 Tax=unclassified Ensifer TaxID=2633371 RepID=UPI001781983B|nr:MULTISPECIES: hypothetical protein [unclassified Ensifer]MBD9647482.1 hypothetical protein [Ensifer sp. ENS09]QRY68663.1 hypothetical protein JVX98_10445 [Ensifer sp. PDNC004]